MAQVGVSKLFYASYAVNNSTVSYSSGAALAKAVNVDIAPESGDAINFYADNAICESAAVFTGGTLTLDIDSLSASVAAALLGLTVDSVATPSGSEIAYKAGVVAPYLGVGVVFKNIIGGAESWMGVVLTKVQFQTPELSQATQGETIEFTAPQITATIMRDDSADAVWKYEGYFSTEANAVAWIKSKLSIT